MSSQLETDSKPRDIPYLDGYAMERWECVLHYMVGSQQQEGISADAVRILLHAGLMKRSVRFMIISDRRAETENYFQRNRVPSLETL
jgi:transcription initiation factor TFIIH subunit 4